MKFSRPIFTFLVALARELSDEAAYARHLELSGHPAFRPRMATLHRSSPPPQISEPEVLLTESQTRTSGA